MMKSIVLASAVAALLVLSGCGDKNPQVDANDGAAVSEQAAPVAPVQASTDSSETAAEYMARIEKELKTIYFDFDKFSIKADMQADLSADAAVANSNASKFQLKLEGNCDEWGSDEYNFALGLKRAESVKKALVAEGVNADRISMVSFGESSPVCTDKTKECWAQNRRVDFKLLP
ncbi:MAG TPA: peptidoglycan-associated lipoprotein Pal [Sulfurimonas sp.]|nr:peptidoglycan-associated lipoprotein Pal [Sulfurimonas sp.]